MIRPARDADRATVEARLTARIDDAMFPLTNLRAHGLTDGFPSPHPEATRFWLLGDSDLCGLSVEGFLMPLIAKSTDLSGLRSALAGQMVSGGIGPAASVRPVMAALGLGARPARLDKDEPGFALSLSDLRICPPAGASLVPVSADLRPLAVAWRAAAKIETEGLAPAHAAHHAEGDVAAWIAGDSHRILMVDGAPVALTGFNATLPEVVQVGGVYTPPALRNRGFARLAVALHLAEARARGVARAVLFASSDAAARAYLALGFQPTRPFTVLLFTEPTTILP